MKKYFMTALFAMTSLLCLQTNANADENETFKTTMQQGILYYNQGSMNPQMYEKAIEQFTIARKYSDNPTPIYNIARAYHHLNRCEDALKNYREYQSITREIKQYGVNDVSTFISQLTAECGVSTASIQLLCTPAETTVTVDNGSPVPCYELNTIMAGQRRLVFQLKGYATASRIVNIKGDESRYFEVTMDKTSSKIKELDQQELLASEDRSSIDRSLLEPPRPLASRGLLWGGVASAGVGTIFAITGAALAATAFDERRNARDDSVYYEIHESKRNAGIALLTIGGAAMIAGITMITIDMIRENKYEQYRSDQLSPYIAVSGDGAAAGIHWTF